jgi:hypothetical protein
MSTTFLTRPFGRATREPLELALFGLVPLIVTAWVVFHDSPPATDFYHAYWAAGRRVLNGQDPYLWSSSQVVRGVAFVYPALSALLFVPFAVASRGPSAILYTLVCGASLIGTLWVLDVRDWRLYGLVLLFDPVIAGWGLGNLSLPLGLGVALTWRYRDRPAVAGLLTAVIISLKLFTWPIGLWLLATRRFQATLYALMLGVALNLIAWAILGFDEFTVFMRVSDSVTKAFFRYGYGVTTLASRIGLSYRAGVLVEITLSVIVAGVCVVVARRHGDFPSFVICIALMLIASPLVWSHYFALLVVPLAIAYPTMNLVWLLPLALWVGPVGGPTTWEIMVAWIVTAAVLIATCKTTGASA